MKDSLIKIESEALREELVFTSGLFERATYVFRFERRKSFEQYRNVQVLTFFLKLIKFVDNTKLVLIITP